MKVDELVRASLRDEAAGAEPAALDLAERVLAVSSRRRTRRMAGAAAATALVVGAAIATPAVLDSRQGGTTGAAAAQPEPPLPRTMITAGVQVLAAYYTEKKVEQPDGDQVINRTYRLLDQRTGRYRADPRWSSVAVAPGLRTAAVLERTLPAQRIGILDLLTGSVSRWIALPQGAGALSFSPDGTRLLATTYDKDPDRLFRPTGSGAGGQGTPTAVSSRTGFAVVDVAAGTEAWHPVPPVEAPSPQNLYGSGSPFLFTPDGQLVYETLPVGEPPVRYYGLTGAKVSAPASYRNFARSMAPAGMSPNGTLIASRVVPGKRPADSSLGGLAKSGSRLAGPDMWTLARGGPLQAPSTQVVDAATGHPAAKLPGEELLAWADDKRLLAWDIKPGSRDEFASRLVLVTIGSMKETVLSAVRTSPDYSAGRWEPVFATR